MARDAPGQGSGGSSGTPRAVRDVVRDRGPRPLHVGRPRGARRGPRPRASGRVPVHPRGPAHDVSQPLLDHAPVRGVRDRRGDQPPVPVPPGPRPDRPVGRVRPAHADGLRLGRPGGRRRGGPGRRPDQQPRRHGRPRRRPAARGGQHLDDDQRDRADPAGAVRGRGRGPGRARASGSPARPRTTSSRSTSPAAPTSSRRVRRCAS